MKIIVYDEYTKELERETSKFLDKHFYSEENPNSIVEQANQREKYFTDPLGAIVVYDKGKIVGLIYLNRRKVEFDDVEIDLCGIGGVCTHKDYRKTGIGMMMLKKSMEIFTKWGCDVAYLCTDIPKFYSPVGYKPVKAKVVFTGKSGRQYTESSAMFAPIKNKKVFEKIKGSTKKLDLGYGNW